MQGQVSLLMEKYSPLVWVKLVVGGAGGPEADEAS